MARVPLCPLAEISAALKGKHYSDAQGRDYTFLMFRSTSEGYKLYFQRDNERVDLSLRDLEGLERVAETSKKLVKSR